MADAERRFNLAERHQRFIDQQVASGRHANDSAVVQKPCVATRQTSRRPWRIKQPYESSPNTGSAMSRAAPSPSSAMMRISTRSSTGPADAPTNSCKPGSKAAATQPEICRWRFD
jgi:hypothetical protein